MWPFFTGESAKPSRKRSQVGTRAQTLTTTVATLQSVFLQNN